MPAMATFDDSAGYAEPLPVAHRHPGALQLSRCDVHLTLSINSHHLVTWLVQSPEHPGVGIAITPIPLMNDMGCN
jgi:hypothetical protein